MGKTCFLVLRQNCLPPSGIRTLHQTSPSGAPRLPALCSSARLAHRTRPCLGPPNFVWNAASAPLQYLLSGGTPRSTHRPSSIGHCSPSGPRLAPRDETHQLSPKATRTRRPRCTSLRWSSRPPPGFAQRACSSTGLRLRTTQTAAPLPGIEPPAIPLQGLGQAACPVATPDTTPTSQLAPTGACFMSSAPPNSQ